MNLFGPKLRMWIALLTGVLVVPFLCTGWLIAQGSRAHQEAVSRRLSDERRDALEKLRSATNQFWEEWLNELDNRPKEMDEVYIERLGKKADLAGFVILGKNRKRVFPIVHAPNTQSSRPTAWFKARTFELSGRPVEAAELYAEVARATENTQLKGEAIRAQIRCLLQGGASDEAKSMLAYALEFGLFRGVCNEDGRLLKADALFLLLTEPALREPENYSIRMAQLRSLVESRFTPMTTSQRVFFGRRLQEMDPSLNYPWIDRESTSLQFVKRHPQIRPEQGLQFVEEADLWAIGSRNRLGLFLIHSDWLNSRLSNLVQKCKTPDGKLVFVAPGHISASAEQSLATGPIMPGWRVAYVPNQGMAAPGLVARGALRYMLTGGLLMAIMLGFGVLVVRSLRRRIVLADLRNDLLANVSHELKIPLTSVRAMVDTLLAAEELDPNRTREYLEVIGRENQRLSRLVENFLTSSRLETGKYRFSFTARTVDEILAETEVLARTRIDLDACEFHVVSDCDDAVVQVDIAAIETALLNLVENAFKYSPAEKWIELAARRDGQTVRFEVRDRGEGLSPDQTAKAFHRYYRVNQRLDQEVSGCGIGLSIVDLVAKAHDGVADVKSQPGEGSCFTISIPVEDR